MFKTLGITNFQAHREASLTFHPGVNVITGTSDSGKTAILRSLSWLMNNRPSGDAFKNWDAPLKEPVSVQLELEDGSCIVLERQNGKNSYTLYDKDGNPITFSAIRSDVPKEIVELLNMAEYNFQSQHQSYFLIQDTPGEVAKKLNDLVGLSVIDTLFSNIASKIRKASTNISILTSRRTDLERDLDKYKNLDQVKTIIEKIEKTQAEVDGIQSSLISLDLKISSVQAIEDQQAELIPYTDLEPRIVSTLTKIEEATKEQASIDRLSSLCQSIRKIDSSLEVNKEWIKLEPKYTKLSDKIKEVEGIQSKKTSLYNLIYGITSLNTNIGSSQANVKKLIKEYVDKLHEFKICPTCGTNITAECLASIERSLS